MIPIQWAHRDKPSYTQERWSFPISFTEYLLYAEMINKNSTDVSYKQYIPTIVSNTLSSITFSQNGVSGWDTAIGGQYMFLVGR